MYDDSRAGDARRRGAGGGRRALGPVWPTGSSPSWALPKLLWWRDEGMLRDGARLAHQPDVITAKLVGRPVATRHQPRAQDRLRPDRLALADRGAREAARRPGRCCRPCSGPARVLGHVGADAAERTGLPEGVPVVAGHDRQLRRPARARARCRRGSGTRCSAPPSRSRAVTDDAAARSDRRGVLPPRPLRRPVAARRRVRHRRGRDHGAVPRGRTSTCSPSTLARSATSRCAIRWPSHGERFPFVATRCARVPRRRPAARTARRTSTTRRACSPRCASGSPQVERLCFDLLAQRRRRRQRAGQLHRRGVAQPWWNQLRCDLLGVEVRIPQQRRGVRRDGRAGGRGRRGRRARLPPVGWCRRARCSSPTRIAGPSWPPATPTSSTLWRGRGWLDARTAAHAREQRRRMTTPRSGPVPVLLAGDEFVLNRLMADELASVAGPAPGRCARSNSRGRAWPSGRSPRSTRPRAPKIR